MMKGAILRTTSGLVAAAGMRSTMIGRRVLDFLTQSIAEGIMYPTSCVSVAIEDGSFSVVRVSRFLFRAKVTHISEHRVEGPSHFQPEVVSSTLSTALKELKAIKKGIVLVIPQTWVLIRRAELPASVRDNICDVVAFELDRLTPFTAEDAYYDFRITGEDEGKIGLAIFAAKADPLNAYIKALEEQGIIVTRLTFSLWGLSSFCNWLSGKSEFVFLEKNSNAYHGGLTISGSVICSFDVSFSGNGDGKLPLVQRILSRVGDRGCVSVEKAMNSGLIACVSEGERSMFNETELGLKASMLDQDEVKRRLRIADKVTNIPYHALGAALDGAATTPQGVNLLAKGRNARRLVSMAPSVVLFLVLTILSVLYIRAPLAYETKRLHEIERQIGMRKEAVKKTETLRKEVEVLGREIATVDDFNKKRPMVLAILKEITWVLPKSAWLTRARVTDSAVELEGYAASASEILPKLDQSKYLKKVEFASPTIRDQRMNADRFVMKMEIEGFGSETERGGKDEKK